jgi:hypothetical protein
MAARSLNSALRDLAKPAGIGPVHCAGYEILRRMFVTVRDRNWQEIASTHWDSVIDEPHRSATLMARHTSDLVDFEWQGRLYASDDLRELRFAFEGKALRDIDVCRLGLIVLHPVDSLVGARLIAKGPQGIQHLTVPAHIHPQPIINAIPGAMTEPFVELIIEHDDVGVLELCFEGEVFELEDQRNWGDASFKTYCTPLRLGFPRAVKAGTLIAHSVDVRFRPASAQVVRRSPGKSGASRVGPSSAHWFTAAQDRSDTLPGRFPAIGCEWRTASAHAAPSEDPPEWQHIYFDVTEPEAAGALRALLLSTSSAKIEIGIEAEGQNKQSADLRALLRKHRDRIARLLIYGSGTTLPTAEAVNGWLQRLDVSATAQIPLLAATRGYYVEFNRGATLDAPVSGIAFPLTATVHADDAATITDNVATIRDMADTARHLTPRSQLAVAPLALHYPPSAKTRNFQRQLLAPWLAATLIHAAAARINSITLATEVVDGIVSSERGHAAPFLTGLIECAGLEGWPLEASRSSGLHGLALGGRQAPARLLIVNLATDPRLLSLAGISLHAAKTSNAVTGAPLATNGTAIEVPPLQVVWVEMAK